MTFEELQVSICGQSISLPIIRRTISSFVVSFTLRCPTTKPSRKTVIRSPIIKISSSLWLIKTIEIPRSFFPISYDGKFVKFWYKDVETKEKETLELPLFEFMFRIIQHIPPKNLKLVRRYGIYSRRIKKKLKEVLKTLKNSRLFNINVIPWDKRIEKWQGKNPLVCPRCNKKMKLVSFEHKKYGIFKYGST